MGVNLYKVKKWGAGAMIAFVPTITFFIMILSADFVQAIIGFGIVTPIVILLSHKLTAHPIIDYLEGKGLLVLTLDSTGVIDAFIVGVKNPYIAGNYKGKNIETIFDRESLAYMTPPKKIMGILKKPDDKKKAEDFDELTMLVPKERNSVQFGFNQFPVLIYNKNLETFITKDALANFEKDTFVNHMVLYLNRKVEDLTSQLRDFARYIIEQTRPKKSLFGSALFKWLLIIIVIAVLAALLAPYIMGGAESIAAPATRGAENILKPLG
jgi:hypothetical protein